MAAAFLAAADAAILANQLNVITVRMVFHPAFFLRERAEGEDSAVWLVLARQKGNTADPFNASERILRRAKR